MKVTDIAQMAIGDGSRYTVEFIARPSLPKEVHKRMRLFQKGPGFIVLTTDDRRTSMTVNQAQIEAGDVIINKAD